MKSTSYVPEAICLVLFTFFSCLWVISLKEEKTVSAKLSPLLSLEKLIPQHKVQLLNANFSDQLHYDLLAQLQSQVETLVSEVNVGDTSQELFKEYRETSLSYIQLTSMLKTSQRLISENAQLVDTQLMNVIDNIRVKMFSFISTPNRTDKATLTRILDSIDTDNDQQTDWRYLQLVKLHSLFILENYELTANYREKLIDMPVNEAIVQEQAFLQHQIRKTNIKLFTGLLGTVLSLMMLVVVVIKRNEYALKKISSQHKEFATSLMDMLGPHADMIQAKHTRDERKAEKSARPRTRSRSRTRTRK